MKRRYILAVGGVVILAPLLYFTVRSNRAGVGADILTNAKFGTFRVEVETTGELEAKNSVKISGPSDLRAFQIWQFTIQSIVDEGTVVKKGDWVATLDPSEFQNKYNQKQIDYEKADSKFAQTKLDTTLEMRQARNELINLKYEVEEKEIILKQSEFEPPATIKQGEINVDKASRAYSQALDNYKIKKSQNVEKMKEVGAELRKVQNDYSAMSRALESFRVLAPEDGMVIYEKGWDGRAIKAGSTVSTWDPTVATLPDLTKMVSKTYVNEVDVRKVKAGQTVEVGLDAYPDKMLHGAVIRVANVGEQRPNSDAKVFEVTVELGGTDPSLRPSMTTSNKIVAQVVDSAVYVPLECLHNQGDSVTYVYKKDGITTVKQEVQVGITNANNAIIKEGLNQDDRLFLSVPPTMEDMRIQLLPSLNGKRNRKDEQSEVAEAAMEVPR